jgi:hypothetical protein
MFIIFVLENIGYLLSNVLKFSNYRKYFCIASLTFAVILMIFPISFAAAWSQGGIIGSGASFSGLGATSWGPNRVDVFAVISSNIFHRWYDPNNLPPGWSTTTDGRPLWEPVGSPPGGADGSPATTTWGTNRLDVFVKSGNGQIYHRWYDPNNLPPGWSTAAGTSAEPYWESVGSPPGGADGSPATTTWGTNRVDVFVLARNDDTNIWHKYFQGNRWSNWEPQRMTCIAPSPAAASWGPGRVDVITPATNCLLPPRPSGFTNHPWIENYEWRRGFVEAWVPDLLPPLALSSEGPNRLDFFGFGRNGEIHHLYCRSVSECIP